MPHVYAALLEPEPEGGFTVAFPEIGFGATWEEVLRQAEDMLEEAVLGLIAHGQQVPEPTAQIDIAAGATCRAPVTLPVLTAAKLEVYRAMSPSWTRPGAAGPAAELAPEKAHPYLRRLPFRPPRTTRTRLSALCRRFVATSEPV